VKSSIWFHVGLLTLTLMAIAALFFACSQGGPYTLGPGPYATEPGPYATSPGWSGLAPSEQLPRSVPSAPHGWAPAADEELWVIARGAEAVPAQPMQRPVEGQIARLYDESDEVGTRPATSDDDFPGSGALVTSIRGRDTLVPIPLQHTEVHAAIDGYIATVDVQQQFHNPFDQKIEAVYVFPLPENAAVTGFVMTIGDRHIRGIIREREEAVRIYKEARRQGHTASLLTQQRPNVFTQKVANIEPGRSIDVDIRYFHTLTYDDGWYEFVFPMVVGPRFNPPYQSDGIGAVGAGHHGDSGQSTEVQYLNPDHQRSGQDISLSVDLDARLSIEDLACNTHDVLEHRRGSGRVEVNLAPHDRIPNRDFVLRYRVAGDQIKSTLLTHHDDRGGFFSLMLYPPQDLASLHRQPMEMIFVIDCSGSMSGRPIEQAKAAIDEALDRLETSDTFQIIRFSDRASAIGSAPIPATRQNIRDARRYLDSLKGGGGTMMLKGIKAALSFEHDPHRLRVVTFLTDGYIGNEKEILETIADTVGSARLFSFGVGSAPNRHLMAQMAKLGRGMVAYVGLDDDAPAIMQRFFERISHPAMTDLALDWGDLDVADVYPDELPDLFVGRPVILTGRFEGSRPSTIRITGSVGDRRMTIDLPFEPGAEDESSSCPALPSVWARAQIASLTDLALIDQDDHEVAGQIRHLALTYGLVSNYTAFVAVDSSYRTAGDHGITVPVPVPTPDGVRYDTTVTE